MYVYIYIEYDRRRPGHTRQGAAHQHQLGPAADHRRAGDTGILYHILFIPHMYYTTYDIYIYKNMTV